MSLAHTFMEAAKAQLDRSSLVPSEWMCKNFTHPRDDRQAWNFNDHEFQIEIANQGDDVREVCCIKPAQTGLSTLQIRVILTFVATHEFMKCSYVLPTAQFSREFTQSRFDPAIESSPVIKGLIRHDTDNTAMKKIGSCFILMRGTSGATAAISFDLDLIVTDEIDFCNQATLSTFYSRLQHSDLKLKRDFSTPTLPNYGISQLYDNSSQAIRLIKHYACGQWVEINFFKDVVIPGFNKPMSDYRSVDAFHPGVEQAFFCCPFCQKEITAENMADPDSRSWVDKHPGHWRKGFRVSFWDVPRYNPLVEVLRSVKDYTYGDWVNFRLGYPYESAENSFIESVIRSCCVLESSYTCNDFAYNKTGVYNIFMGVDLGKIAHVAIGGKGTTGKLDILCLEQVDISTLEDTNLSKFLEKIIINSVVIKQVTDSMPDYSVSMTLAVKFPERCYGAQYAGNAGLDIYQWNNNGVVKIDRDGHFDDLASFVNSGSMRFPKTPAMQVAIDHFKVMKKAKVQTAKGVEEKWTSTSTEDHFVHAIGYLFAAYSSIHGRLIDTGFCKLPQLTTVRLK